MKYIVVALVVLVGIWSWRRGREQERQENQRRRAPQPPAANHAPTTDMVACAHCGLHLPANDAVQGQRGVYCGHAHRQAHES